MEGHNKDTLDALKTWIWVYTVFIIVFLKKKNMLTENLLGGIW